MNKAQSQRLLRACALLALSARKSNQTDFWRAVGQIRSALDGFTDDELRSLAQLAKRSAEGEKP